MWVNEALVIGGDPDGASQFVLRQNLINQLKTAFYQKKIAIVTGPSKCGKTWLVKNVLREPQKAIISLVGQDLTPESGGLWRILEVSKYIDIDELEDLGDSLRDNILRFMSEKMTTHLCLLIDDIHFASADALTQVGYDLKYLHDHMRKINIDIVVVGVDSPPLKLLTEIKDLEGRFTTVKCSHWEPSQLRQIITLGCNIQSYGYTFASLDPLTAEVFSSPHLMVTMMRTIVQTRCLKKLPGSKQRVYTITPNDINEAANIVIRDDYDSSRKMLNDIFLTPRAHGVQFEGQIKQYTLKLGGELSFNKMFWYIASGAHRPTALPFNYMELGVGLGRLVQEFQSLIADPVNLQELDRALKIMYIHYLRSYKSATSRRDPILDLWIDPDYEKKSIDEIEIGDRIWISDPYFLFVCRNSKVIKPHGF